MKVSYKCTNGLLEMFFSLDYNDGTDFTEKVKIGRYQCKFHMPYDWSLDHIHPDVLALATLLIVYPFMDKSLELPIGISQSFHDLFKKETKKSIYPIDKNLKPRIAPKNAIPGLAYSGGFDSTAALTIMPTNTACIFLDRILPKDLENTKKLYNKQAVYTTYDQLKKQGRQGYLIKTDLEYIRSPRGFSVEQSSTIPALLLSDYIGLDSIATGTTLEQLFLEYDLYFFKDRQYSVNWKKLFDGAGVSLNHVTAGMSVIANMKIVLNSPNHSLAQWCMSGEGYKPCLNCKKCFQKKLVEMILLKQNIPDKFLDDLFFITEARTMLKKLPIRQENVITYITSHYNGNHHLMNLLKKRTRGDLLATDWMEKWYMPSKDFIPEKYFNPILKELCKYIDVMNSHDEINMHNWNIHHVINSPIYQAYHKEFLSELKLLIKRKKKEQAIHSLH